MISTRKYPERLAFNLVKAQEIARALLASGDDYAEDSSTGLKQYAYRTQWGFPERAVVVVTQVQPLYAGEPPVWTDAAGAVTGMLDAETLLEIEAYREGVGYG